MRFNTNHDKNAWDEPAVARYGPDGLRLTTALVHTLPGLPLIYTGEEVANDRKLDLFEKVGVDWSRPRDMEKLLTLFGTLRKSHPSIARGDMIRAGSSHPKDVYTFFRRAGDDIAFVALNFSSAERRTAVTVPAALLPPERTTMVLRDAFSGERLEVHADRGSGFELTLGPRAFKVFVAGGN
jgi:glycosidase